MTSSTTHGIVDVIATRPSISVDQETKEAHLVPGLDKSSVSVTVVSDDSRDSGDERYPVPTEDEKRTLRHVPATLPLVSYSLCLVEFAERASYYGAKTVFSNFIQFPLPRGGNGAGAPPRGTQQTAGALGMGLQAASGLTLLFAFLAYVIPIFGGWWADVKIGRYWAIVYGVLICGVAHIVQIFGAIPSVLQKGPKHSIPPFIIGFVLLAVGAGIFKPNIAPTILDQHTHKKQYTQVLKSGEKVIVDPEATMTRTMLIFYGLTNVGAFYMLATTYSEKYVGYWLAFLEAGAIYFLLPILLALVYKRTVKAPPSGDKQLKLTLKITGTALRRNKFRFWRRNFWDAAKPSTLTQQGVLVEWTDKQVDEVHRTVTACEILFYFPIWYINDGGIGSIGTSQGASMTTNGAPNDILNNFSALTIILAVPILTYVVYPGLERLGIRIGPIKRILFGFFLATVSSAIGAIVQWRVYETSPCGYAASTCDNVSPLSIWWQIPNVALGALSECFCAVTAYELAYARSPASMRGLVTAIYLFTIALSSALGEILIPAIKDPWLIWIWAAPGIALAVQSILFWYKFRALDHEDFIKQEDEEDVGPAESEKQDEKV